MTSAPVQTTSTTTTTDLSCVPAGNKIKIQSTTGAPLLMREVRVFSSDVNVAFEKPTTQSSDIANYEAGNAVDGKWRTWSSTGSEDCLSWWEVDLEATYSIDKIIIVNRKCESDTSCSCGLSFASVSILDENDEWVAAALTRDTCDKGWVVPRFRKPAGCV